jgi:hypothetical protein
MRMKPETVFSGRATKPLAACLGGGQAVTVGDAMRVLGGDGLYRHREDVVEEQLEAGWRRCAARR